MLQSSNVFCCSSLIAATSLLLLLLLLHSPWCYVGKRRLEKAIKQVTQQHDVPFTVHWLPYQLNPTAAEQGIAKLQAYNDKFGPAKVAQIVPAMTVRICVMCGGGTACATS